MLRGGECKDGSDEDFHTTPDSFNIQSASTTQNPNCKIRFRVAGLGGNIQQVQTSCGNHRMKSEEIDFGGRPCVDFEIFHHDNRTAENHGFCQSSTFRPNSQN